MNSIKRDAYILADGFKIPIEYLQGTNGIPIEFTFRDFDIPSGSSVRVYVKKASGKAIFENVDKVFGNIVTINVLQQMFAEVGVATIQLEIVHENGIIATFSHPVNVKKTEIPINSESGSGFIEDLLGDVQAATRRANGTADAIEQKAENGDFSATVNIGKTETGIPGTTASVNNVGTAKDAVFDFVIPEGAKGDSGVTAPSNGYFSLWVDSETGNLYCDYMDNETPPQFELKENGDLYILIPEDEPTVMTGRRIA